MKKKKKVGGSVNQKIKKEVASHHQKESKSPSLLKMTPKEIPEAVPRSVIWKECPENIS